MSVKKKPLVVVTRKLPDSIETRMRELFDARLNLDDTPMTEEQIAEAIRTADVLVPTVTDEITEELLKQPDCKLKMIANFGNGVDNIDVEIRSEEHTSELQSHSDLVCRLLLEKKKKQGAIREELGLTDHAKARVH